LGAAAELAQDLIVLPPLLADAARDRVELFLR
jgi:hypothetical protein